MTSYYSYNFFTLEEAEEDADMNKVKELKSRMSEMSRSYRDACDNTDQFKDLFGCLPWESQYSHDLAKEYNELQHQLYGLTGRTSNTPEWVKRWTA